MSPQDDQDDSGGARGPTTPSTPASVAAPSSINEHKAIIINIIPPADPPFHVFTKAQKWAVVWIIGAAGLFSGLSSNIYFPSLHRISEDLNVSRAAVSMTITSYLVIQGLSPLLWGPLSDTLGRRPIYIASFVVYITANLVLSFTPNYVVLLIFRALQSAGSASTVSIGNGVIQDIATPLERGTFIGFYQSVRNGSIAIGPIIGGVLSHFYGFRASFIFLTIISSFVLVLVVACLPETLRSIAGNGTKPLSGIHKPLYKRFKKKAPAETSPPPVAMTTTTTTTEAAERPAGKKVTAMTFLEPIKMFKEPDILCTLLFGAAVYTVWSMAVASTTGIFKHRFHLNELKLGLVFLPNGLGTIAGSHLSGHLMKRDFLRYEKRYLAQHPHAAPPSTTRNALAAAFPIERARLRQVPWLTVALVIATALYGCSVLPADGAAGARAAPGWVAVPLLLQFVMAATSNAIFAINTTLITDLYPGSGAGATAVNNLARCGVAAGGVACVEAMLARLGPHYAFLSLAMMVVGVSALLGVEWVYGMRWRARRERIRLARAGTGGSAEP